MLQSFSPRQAESGCACESLRQPELQGETPGSSETEAAVCLQPLALSFLPVALVISLVMSFGSWLELLFHEKCVFFGIRFSLRSCQGCNSPALSSALSWCRAWTGRWPGYIYDPENLMLLSAISELGCFRGFILQINIPVLIPEFAFVSPNLIWAGDCSPFGCCHVLSWL